MGNTNDRDTASQSEETKEDGETNLTVKEVDLLMANTSMTRREVVDWYKLFMVRQNFPNYDSSQQ